MPRISLVRRFTLTADAGECLLAEIDLYPIEACVIFREEGLIFRWRGFLGETPKQKHLAYFEQLCYYAQQNPHNSPCADPSETRATTDPNHPSNPRPKLCAMDATYNAALSVR